MKYRIRLQKWDDTGSKQIEYFGEVEGTPVVIPGYEEFSFFSRVAEENYIVISEVSTGYRIGDYFDTLEEGIRVVKSKIDKVGIDWFRQTVKANKMPEDKQ